MLGHPETERADPHEEDVGRVWRDSGRVYGAGKIKAVLEHEGIVMSRRRVNRIMKAGGMASSYSRARYRPHPAKPNDGPAPNLSARGFDGCKPRTHLASDPAYVGGRQFMGVHMPARRAREPRDRRAGRRDAARRGSRAGRIRHAALPVGRHRGVPHRPGRRVHRGTHRAHARRVRHHAFPVESRQPLRQRGGRIHQSSHQKELVYANTYTSVEQLRSDANRYVWWYNHQRLHSTLGYMSPVEFTQQGKTL